jgi:OmpA-OmpF porin, OOP family
MLRILLALLALLLVSLTSSLVGATGALAASGDVPGAKDYPGIGRFKGSVITGYEVKDFDASKLQAAAFKDGKATDERKPEGRVTRIAYKTGAGPSILEVAKNFEGQLEKAGFTTLLSCTTDDCGAIPFTEALDVLPIPAMWVDGFDYRYWSGRKAGEGGAETYASVLVSKNNDEITAELVVTQVGAMENKMIDAAAMAKGLGSAGHIALYGIYFDTDKAVVKPESAPTLAEIAKLMAAQPELHVFIVGHTDNQGTYDYNMDLSKRRAAAVAAALAKSYGVAGARMQTAGVGFLAPVASNASDEGRAQNRRVELVQP